MRRDHKALYGFSGIWAWSPTTCSTASTTPMSERHKSSCRSSVARFRVFAPSTSGRTKANFRGLVADDPRQVLRREELANRHGPGNRAEEAVGLVLVSAERAEERLHLRGRRLERRQLVREVVQRQRRLVPLPLVLGERIVERPAAAQARVDRL